MRKIKRILMVLMLIGLMSFAQTDVKADTPITNIPYGTFTIGSDGHYVRTANAYEGTFVLNKNFQNPQDIFIKDDLVYIADSGNSRIYVYNLETTESFDITYDSMKEPTGIYVDDDYKLYVADATSNIVLVFDENYNVLKEIGRPDEPLFGETTAYEPRKVVADLRGNIYVVSEAGINGIIQMDANGDFLGFYGINKVEITLGLLIRRALMSAEQKEMFASLTPKSTTNLTIDDKGVVYTVIKNEYTTPLKKLNIEGNNILSGISVVDPAYEDITVDSYGNIYTVSQGTDTRGIVGVHDSFGNLLFKFGSQELNSMRVGEFAGATGIAVDGYGDIWVLDGNGNNVQVFSKTEFASSVLTGIELYRIGAYDESAVYFQEIIRQNSLFALAHSRLGKYYERNEDFEEALLSYRIANNKEGYSTAYWEVRDAWISQNIVWILVAIGLVLVSHKVFVKSKVYDGYIEKKQAFGKKLLTHQWVKELKVILGLIKHPIDTIYDIKFKQKIRVRTAFVLYLVFILLNILSNYYIKGFLFKSNVDDIVFLYEILKWSVPLLLFGLANYLISSLQNGEAFYRDIFIGTIVAMLPIFLFKVPLDVLSNFLTYNEAFIMNFGYLIIYAWSVLLLLMILKDLNNFKVSELIVNLFMTFFVMIIIIILYLIISILSSQLYDFVVNIVKELMYR